MEYFQLLSENQHQHPENLSRVPFLPSGNDILDGGFKDGTERAEGGGGEPCDKVRFSVEG